MLPGVVVFQVICQTEFHFMNVDGIGVLLLEEPASLKIIGFPAFFKITVSRVPAISGRFSALRFFGPSSTRLKPENRPEILFRYFFIELYCGNG